MARYILETEDGGQYSADARDYWYLAPSDHVGGDLVRVDHPYRTTSGRIVYGERLIKSAVTRRDLDRILPSRPVR